MRGTIPRRLCPPAGAKTSVRPGSSQTKSRATNLALLIHDPSLFLQSMTNLVVKMSTWLMSMLSPGGTKTPISTKRVTPPRQLSLRPRTSASALEVGQERIVVHLHPSAVRLQPPSALLGHRLELILLPLQSSALMKSSGHQIHHGVELFEVQLVPLSRDSRPHSQVHLQIPLQHPQTPAAVSHPPRLSIHLPLTKNWSWRAGCTGSCPCRARLRSPLS